MPHLINCKTDSHNHTVRKPQLPVLDLHEVGLNKMVVKNAVVISLKKSYDTRLVPFLAQNVFDGTMEIIEGIDGAELPPIEPGVAMNKGDMGCLLSHLNAIKYAINNGLDCILILEDDAVFVPDFNEKLKKAMQEMPANWDMLWLGGSDNLHPIPYSANLKRLVSSWGGYGYILRDTVYDKFVNLFSEKKRSCDDYYRLNHSKYFSFRTVEPLVKHAVGQSDRMVINHNTKRQ